MPRTRQATNSAAAAAAASSPSPPRPRKRSRQDAEDDIAPTPTAALVAERWSTAKGLQPQGGVLAAALLKHDNLPSFGTREPPPDSTGKFLIKSIVFQQLATKVAEVIWGRVESAVQQASKNAGEVAGDLDLDGVIAAAESGALKAAGLSARKVSYCQAVAQALQPGGVLYESDGQAALLRHPDLRTRLLSVRGIGPWSVDIFSMFHARDADVVPAGDLGIRTAVQQLWKLPKLPTQQQVLDITQSFAPHRSFFAMAAWKVLDDAKRPTQGRAKRARKTK